MNKILPIIVVVVFFFPELSFAVPYERDAWEPRSGGGGFSLGGIIMLLAFLVAYIMSPKEYEGFTFLLQIIAVVAVLYFIRLALT